MSADLAAFLLARLEEDEALARAAPPRRWTCTGHYLEFFTGDAQDWDAGSLARFERAADARLAAAHDPARVLADVEARRGILRNHGDQHDCGDPRSYDYPYVGCRDLRLLAQVYAEHEDYRQEWKP